MTWSASSVAWPRYGSAPLRSSRFVVTHSLARVRKASRSSASPPGAAVVTVMVCPLSVGEDRHLVALLHRIGVGLSMNDDPAQVQVEVVFPGDTDPAMHLDTVLDQLRTSLSDVGLSDSDHLGGVGSTGLDCPGGVDRDRLGGLDPQLHVGEAVFEGLIGRECATE